MPRCREGEIPLYPAGEGVTVRCVLHDPAVIAAMPPDMRKGYAFPEES
jgi:hypothetical protein